METVSFTHIGNTLLRENVQHVWRDIAELGSLLSDAEKSNNKKLENCLRKTIIIYAASVLEALLRWTIKKHLGAGKILLEDERKRTVLHALPAPNKEDEYEITLARKTIEKDVEKLDFNRMIHLCKKKGLLESDLLNNIDTIRKMRNDLHIGGLTAITKTYAQKDMGFALAKIKETVQAMQ